MIRFSFLLPVVLGNLVFVRPAVADSLAVKVLSASSVTELQARKVVREVEQALIEASSWSLKSSPRKGLLASTRPCPGAEKTCLIDRARALASDYALLLELNGLPRGVSVKSHLVDLAHDTVTSKQSADVRYDDLPSLEDFVTSLIPAAGRKGYGSLWVEAKGGAVVKTSGRQMPVSSPEGEVALPSGPHEVDIVYPDGKAVLRRLNITEGTRAKVPFEPEPFLDLSKREEGPSAMRLTAYGLWSGAGAALAASLIAGALSNHAVHARGSSCVGDDRSCLPWDQALRQQNQAQVMARNANIFAGLGWALAAAGGAVFGIDAWRAKR